MLARVAVQDSLDVQYLISEATWSCTSCSLWNNNAAVFGLASDDVGAVYGYTA